MKTASTLEVRICPLYAFNINNPSNFLLLRLQTWYHLVSGIMVNCIRFCLAAERARLQIHKTLQSQWPDGTPPTDKSPHIVYLTIPASWSQLLLFNGSNRQNSKRKVIV